ncbi:intracellular short-chain-length polyhydroxyalkanoate depolymerase [Isachenkonia alkalipeptolytica]|uniref:Alpha/beta hydrolase n=1 Tax=Isachenkonia alkalipeptolytica TaxID=2565777 RepID=A0AA43XL85_9CLOT|nr:alpha/beta hydrolase [Isachenkonia alkalipeptolytica]NBG88441.1 alpha/beta hydrolase [Isachenkonia alkalipeptolytica]
MNLGTVDLSNGESIFYREVGGGEKTLLLIHGNMSSSKHWEPVYEKMKEKYKIFAVDLRGMGESSYHSRFDSLKELADDLAEFCEILKLRDLGVAGWSTGGGIAMELAADYPDLVDKLILVESVSPKGYPLFKKNDKGEPIPGEFYETKEAMAKDPVQVLPAVLAIENQDFNTMKQIWDAAIYVVNKPEENKYREYLEETLKQRNLVDIDWALATFNISEEHNGMVEGNGKINNIKQPTLILGAELDYVVPLSMVEETSKAFGEYGELYIFKDSGHSPITDVTEELIEKIEGFIE